MSRQDVEHANAVETYKRVAVIAETPLNDHLKAIQEAAKHGPGDEELTAMVRPQGRPEMPLVGFFGTRTPIRPNPISVTTVPLIERQGSILYVRNLDVYDGTPVLDIKPYLSHGDCHPLATEPEWMRRLWAIHDAENRER